MIFAVTVREKDGVLRVVLPPQYLGRRRWSDGIRASVEGKLGDPWRMLRQRCRDRSSVN